MNETSSYLQTVGRALEILELIGRFPGLTLSELARRTGMNTTVIYRLLFTLSTVGFLQQEPGGKRYYLGDKTLLLGVQSLDNREIKRIAQYYMWDHYERTGDTCILTVPCAGQSICIEKIGSLRDSSSAVRAGGVYPLHKGASNRVLLAFLPAGEQQRYLDDLGMDPNSRQQLQAELDAIVVRGYDFSVGLLTPDRFGLGFPIFDRSGRLAGGFSTGGYITGLTEQDRQEMILRFQAVAAQINLAMGSPSTLNE